MVDYLQDADYLSQIKSDILTLITNGDSSLRSRAELAGITEVESYLAGQYDTALVFLRYDAHNMTIPYTAGDRVVFANGVWEALTDHTGVEPGTSETDWTKIFQRNELVTTYLIDIVLYHLNARIAFDQTSTLRWERYKRAVEWLKAVAEGKLNPNLPLADEDGDGEPDGPALRWGGPSKFKTKGKYF